MTPQLTVPIIDDSKRVIRPFSDFLNYVSKYLMPKGAIVMFYDTIPTSGWEEVSGLTPPSGYKYGKKL